MNAGLWCAGTLALAVGLGLLMAAAPRALPLPRWGRFAFGMAAAPFVLAALTLLTSALWPGAPQPVFAYAPHLAAIILLALCARTPITWRRTWRALKRPTTWPTLLVTLALAAFVSQQLAFYAQQTTPNPDGLQYLAQARHFADHRDFWRIDGIQGQADGSLRGDAHGPLWIAYLAGGLTLADGQSDVSAHLLTRLPFQAALPFYLLAAAAFASVFHLRFAVPLMLCAALAVPILNGAIVSGNRDAFRLGGLLLLMTFLAAHLLARPAKPMRWTALALGAFVCAVAVQGHGLALVLVPITVAAWTFLCLALQPRAWRATALATAVLAAGFTLGAAEVIGAYAATGSWTGDNVAAGDQVAGTPYAEALAARDAARIGDSDRILPRIETTIARDKGWPSLAGAIAFVLTFAALLALIARRRRWTPRAQRIALLCLWFAANTLFMLGAFDVGAMKFGAWTTLNGRYAMQWHMLAGAVAVIGFAWALAALAAPRFWRNLAASALGSLAVLALGLQTARALQTDWPMQPTPQYETLIAFMTDLTRDQPARCRILSEDVGLNFYAPRPVVQLYSKYQRDLLQERDVAALDAMLRARDFCAIVIFDGMYIHMSGYETPLMALLNGERFEMHKSGAWFIYLRRDP